MPVPEPRPGMTGVATVLRIVMAGPDPAIQTPGVGDWIPGSSPDLTRGPGMTGVATVLQIVMAGLDPAIQTPGVGDWMPGSSPGMTRRRLEPQCPSPSSSAVMTSVTTVLSIVMAGPDPAIQTPGAGGWMPGSSPGRARA